MNEEQTKINELYQKIDDVLEKLRPFLQREGGDIKLDHVDLETGTCYVQMTGACNGCYMANSDVSDSVAVLLMDEIPEIKDVQLVQPDAESFESMLQRLRDSESAFRELEEINKKREDEKNK